MCSLICVDSIYVNKTPSDHYFIDKSTDEIYHDFTCSQGSGSQWDSAECQMGHTNIYIYIYIYSIFPDLVNV